MMNVKILIVEDEKKVANSLGRGLRENGYSCDVAYDGKIGLSLFREQDYNLILLDLNLPGINGFDLCREIRKLDTNVKILMLTALGNINDKVDGFDSGADDYLVKPFEFRELLARIRVLLKRNSAVTGSQNLLTVADLVMNLEARTVKRGNVNIDLTAREFNLLEYLVRNKGKVISRVDIASKIWDINFDTGTNVIDVYVNFLRKKIEKNFDQKIIFTQIGIGYIVKEPESTV